MADDLEFLLAVGFCETCTPYMTNVMFKMATKTNAIECGILCAKSQNYLFDMCCNLSLKLYAIDKQRNKSKKRVRKFQLQLIL